MPKDFLQNLKAKFIKKPSAKELSRFAKELRFLLEAGLPLIKALSILERSSGKLFAGIVRGLKDDVSSGLSLSQALRRAGLFPELFVNVVAAGEGCGGLEGGLSRLAEHFESKDELKKKVVSSLSYPALVLFVSFASILFISFYLVPTVGGVLSGLGVPLPLFTRIVASMGEFIISFWYLIILASIILTILVSRYLKKRFGPSFWEAAVLKLPIAGDVARKLVLARISGTFSTLLSSGVPMLSAISVAAAASANTVYKDALSRTSKDVEEGNSLSSALERTGLFPEAYCEMVCVGESSGKLDVIFADLERYFGREAEAKIKAVSSMIEPAATVVVGGIVAFIVLSVFLPLLSIVDALAK